MWPVDPRFGRSISPDIALDPATANANVKTYRQGWNNSHESIQAHEVWIQAAVLNWWKPDFLTPQSSRPFPFGIVEMPLDWTVKHDVLFPTTRKETALQQEVFWYVLCPSNKDRTCNGNQDLYSRCRQTCFITRGYHSAIAQCLCFIRESWRWRMTFVATRQLKQQPMSVTCKVFTSKVSKLVLAAFPFFCHAQTVASHSVKMLAYVAPSSWTFSLRGLLCGE